MIDSILLPQFIFEELKNCTALKGYVDTRVFPLVAEMGTKYPYVAFSKTSITPTYTKDYYTQDAIGVEIVVADDDYLRSLNIANVVRRIFECKTFNIGLGFRISQVKLTGVSEAYDDNANCYVQRLSFEFIMS